ncbi:MAG: ABC transporter permease [Candidatus Nanoarchaeia archaeon]
MITLFTILEKNGRQLLRSKISSLIIVLGPLLIIFFAGLALSGAALKEVKLSLYSPNEPDLQDLLLEKFEKKGMIVTVASDLAQCKELVKEGATNICVEIAKKESTLIQYDPRFGNQLLFYVDYSKVRLVWIVINSIKTIINEQNLEISTHLLTKITENFQSVSKEITTKRALLDTAIEKGEFVERNFEDVSASLEAARDFSISLQNAQLPHLQILISNQLLSLNSLNATLSPALPPEGKIILANYYQTTSVALTELNSKLGGIILANNQFTTLLNRAEPTQTRTIQLQLQENVNELKKLRQSLDKIHNQLAGTENIKLEEILTPIPILINPISEEQFVPTSSTPGSYLEYLLPALLVLIILFIAPVLSSTLVMKERKSSASFRNKIAPVSPFTFLFSTYFTALILISFQTFILLLISHFAFNINIIQNLPLITLVLIIIISLYTIVGMIIAHLFNTEETALLGTMSFSILLLVLSEFILPIEAAPLFIGKLVGLNPFVITETILRKILVFNLPFASVLTGIVLLLVYLILSVGLLLVVTRFSNKELN